MVQATDGNFYGVTTYGEASTFCDGGCGTIFSITPGGTLTTLYSFCPATGCADGEQSIAGLIQDTNPPNAIANAVDIINFHMKPGNESGNICPAPTPARRNRLNRFTSRTFEACCNQPSWRSRCGMERRSTQAPALSTLTPTWIWRLRLCRGSICSTGRSVSIGIAWYFANSQAQPVEAGTSYQQTYDLLSNASLVTPCAASGTVWSCEIMNSGTLYLIMWDTACGTLRKAAPMVRALRRTRS